MNEASKIITEINIAYREFWTISNDRVKRVP